MTKRIYFEMVFIISMWNIFLRLFSKHGKELPVRQIIKEVKENV